MASAEGALSTKIGQMLGKLRAEEVRERRKGTAANPTKLATLAAQIGELGGIRGMALAAEQAARDAGSRQIELSTDDPSLKALKAAVQRFGATYGRTDIADYVLPPEPSPEQIAADPDMPARRAWCASVNVNDPDSPTARGLYQARGRTIQQLVGDGVLVGGIAGRLPTDAFAVTVEQALRVGRFQGVNIRKFVTDNRDKFRGR